MATIQVIYAVFHPEHRVFQAALFRVVPLLCLLATPLAAQLPAGWKVVPDATAPDSGSAFVQMPPGWHLTGAVRTAALVYDPSWRNGSRFALEWDAFVFPSNSTEPFGIFFGGAGLEGNAPSLYAVVMNTAGQLGVVHRAGTEFHWIVPPARSADIVLPAGQEPSRNVLKVSVETDSVRVAVNGVRAAVFATPGDMSGTFGFRVGSGANLHVTRLDLTTPLAPPRALRRSTN